MERRGVQTALTLTGIAANVVTILAVGLLKDAWLQAGSRIPDEDEE